ncbi:DUF3298/DUF4163 domain-containing protein [Hanstruepera neustonica]|uniref:DUF3298/DUF4163 domain-containing protein n=1 Tax=Hanstruepera neustonica TaxID=1445657 RepID=A0A2K1E3R1_9FLAO|nr:DUF3298 and DUF4163 domain-containing protein [Hanstruepera neustonica]PNQ74922.1 DUF3298/DUF4163 domain-containing protein [Hanstruepera neustonica]
MRSFLIVIILSTYSLLNLSCAEEKSSTLFNEVNMTTPENNLVEIFVPKAKGNNSVSEKINSKINESIIASLQIGDPEPVNSKSVEESITNFNNEYIKFKNEFPESPMVWEAQIDGEVSYQSESLISIAITSYLNTGGAHGILTIRFLNFDTLTGDIISNNDLFSNFSAFEELAKNHFNKEIADKKEDYFDPDNFTLPANIGFDDDGLILFYNTYEIAPYSSGITEIHMAYDEIDALLAYK